VRLRPVLAVSLLALAALPAAAPAASGPTCTPIRYSQAYAGSVNRVLRAKQDLWGNALIARKNGPTYEAVRRLLKPLLYARTRNGRLTSSGVYYLPFAQPLGVHGAQTVALHVADGSEILSQTAKGPKLKIYVGRFGQEPYGSCLARLKPARLASGYLPMLETKYVDGEGTRYRQESFSVRGLGTGDLVSFVRLVATARVTGHGSVIRLVPEGSRRGARSEQGTMQERVEAGQTTTVWGAWLVPFGGAPVEIDATTYAAARERLLDFWSARLAEQPTYSVPEKVVNDAQRALLVQDLALTWRYSIGNQYQEFSFAEALDAAEVMAEYGYPGVTRQILSSTLARLKGSNWRTGEKLTAIALYYRLTGDRPYIQDETPALARLVDSVYRQMFRSYGNGLLIRERFSNDIGAHVYALHGQAAVWQGLEAIADVWKATGHPGLAHRARFLATQLGKALHRAVRRSERRLKDGSLFVPAALLSGHKPFDPVAASRPGSYWNLVVPYALASGFLRPHGREATGILDYMLEHGSRLLGLVRAGAYSLYGNPRYPVSGTDQVYGLNMARFLADNDKPDQLVLSLYGMLGASMTPNTYVSGEAATVSPLRGAWFRSMYMPPNTASNSAYLETLRLMLVHETRDKDGSPVGLELAYSTPRPWLGPGKTIAVNGAPTSFGLLTYKIERTRKHVLATVTVPSRRPPPVLRLRLRVPQGLRLGAVRVNGHRRPVERRTGTVDLSGLRGTLDVVAALRS
jgi:hypothetical protein